MSIAPSQSVNFIRWIPIWLLFIPSIASVVPFWIIGMICAGRAENETGIRPKKWLMLMISLMISLLLYMALSDLLRAGLEYFFKDTNWSTSSYNSFLKNLSARMVVIIMGLPLLAGFWYKATEKSPSKTLEISEALARKYFLTVEIFVLSLFLLFGSGILLYHLFNLVLGVSDFRWVDLIPAFSYGSTAMTILILKIWAYKSASQTASSDQQSKPLSPPEKK